MTDEPVATRDPLAGHVVTLHVRKHANARRLREWFDHDHAYGPVVRLIIERDMHTAHIGVDADAGESIDTVNVLPLGLPSESSTGRYQAAVSYSGRWFEQADENVEQWGLQDVETLLLAMVEEMGELSQAHLEATHEDGDPDRVREELDDLAALVYQLLWAVEGGHDA